MTDTIEEKALTEQPKPVSAVESLALSAGLSGPEFYKTVVATCFKGKPTYEQFMAFAMVAKEYGLNPLTKEIYAFPGQGGSIVPIVGIDGWTAIINRQASYDGMDVEEIMDEGGDVVAVKVSIFRKDRSHPTVVTEYARECARNTDPWKKWPIRMLRHKAVIQCARYAFSLSGIYDPDEGERIVEATVVDAEVSSVKTAIQAALTEAENEPEMTEDEAKAAEFVDGYQADEPQEEE